MKALVQKISIHPGYSKLYSWSKLIAITGGAQAIVQATGLICGILIVRLLPTQEYAYYTLANTMLGTMTVLADGGISSGVMAQGGKVWQDKKKLGAVIATGLYLRKRFAFISFLIVVPILGYLMQQHGASWITVLLIITSIIPALFAALSDSLLEIVPKLHQDIKPLQRNQIKVSIGRLVLSCIALFAFPWACIAILGNGIPRIYGNMQLKQVAKKFAIDTKQLDTVVKCNILKVVKRIMPGSIYYCISTQITIWLISVFGSATSIAQVGALGRFSMLLNIFSVLISTLIVPRFARAKSEKGMMKNLFLTVQLGIIGLSCIIALFVWFFPIPILCLLGRGYNNLSVELMLSITGGCISLMAGVSFSLFVSRGWAIHPMISIPISILSIVAGIFIFGTSTVIGVLSMNIFIALIQYLINTSYCFIKISKVRLS